jgi:tRNA(His) guanylyltransferase
MDKTSLGDRMKKYERSYENHIIGRVPVIIRLDGKGFSKWTKKAKFDKPFDAKLCSAMSTTMLRTAEKIEGCVFGYTQSDEISFVIKNDQSLESVPWFDNRIQKICSITSSIATAYFNACWNSLDMAFFDARVFAVPSITEVYNYLYWRQNDCTKNSISASCYYEVAKVVGKKTARKLMHGLNQNQQQELLFSKSGINWNDYETKFKRGVGCYRETFVKIVDGNECTRSGLVVDEELPIFTQKRYFLESIVGDKNV